MTCNNPSVDKYPLKKYQGEVFVGNLPQAYTRDQVFQLFNFTQEEKELDFQIRHEKYDIKHGLMNVFHFKVPKQCKPGKQNCGYAFIITTKKMATRLLEEAKRGSFYYIDIYDDKKMEHKLDIKPIDQEKRIKAETVEWVKEQFKMEETMAEPGWFSQYGGQNITRRCEKNYDSKKFNQIDRPRNLNGNWRNTDNDSVTRNVPQYRSYSRTNECEINTNWRNNKNCSAIKKTANQEFPYSKLPVNLRYQNSRLKRSRNNSSNSMDSVGNNSESSAF